MVHGGYVQRQVMFCECSRKVDSLSVGLLPDDVSNRQPTTNPGSGRVVFQKDYLPAQICPRVVGARIALAFKTGTAIDCDLRRT